MPFLRAPLAAILLLVTSAFCHAQTLKLTPPASAQRGSFAKVGLDTDCKTVKFIFPDAGIGLLDIGDLIDLPPGTKPPKKILIQVDAYMQDGVTPLPDGHYRFWAVGAKADGTMADPVLCYITVGRPPNPPTPNPPGPNPPGPVVPTDPLGKAVYDAYQTDTDAKDVNGAAVKKADVAAFLASLYRLSSGTGPGTPSDPNITTASQLFMAMHGKVQLKYPDDALRGVRTAIQKYLDSVLSTSTSAQLTQADRDKAKAEFTRIADALEKLK